jgi:large subunit ribosomal protein L30
MAAKQIKVKLIKSVITCNARQRACVKGLGLKKLNSERTLANTPEVRGMVNKVKFLLKTEEV